MVSGKGALPVQVIKEMISSRRILGASQHNVRPASMDLSISEEIFRVDGIFLPRPHETVEEVLSQIEVSRHYLDLPLEKNVAYLIKLEESLRLPEDVYAFANPKSSTGRNGVHARVLADRISRYDAIYPAGFSGDLWLIVTPKYFPIKISKGTTLSQMRFFNMDTRFNEEQLVESFSKNQLMWYGDGKRPFQYSEIRIKDGDGSVILTIDLDGDIVGWECLGVNNVLDWDKTRGYQPLDFFRPLKVHKGKIQLKEGCFYIFKTKERVRVPPSYACEMVAMDERCGEFRSHFAGYIDPGWGWGLNGNGCGRSLVLEVRPLEDLVLRDEQPIAKIRFECMAEIPEMSYDSSSDSSYAMEFSVPRLAKQFI